MRETFLNKLVKPAILWLMDRKFRGVNVWLMDIPTKSVIGRFHMTKAVYVDGNYWMHSIQREEYGAGTGLFQINTARFLFAELKFDRFVNGWVVYR